MKKVHAAGIALLLATAAVLGMVAANRTTGLGRAASVSAAAKTRTAGHALAQRAHQLDRIEAALRKSLRSRPPKLPPVPKRHHLVSAPPPSGASAPVAAAPAAPATAAAPPRIVYRRPRPIVVVKHHGEGDDGHESGHGGEGGHGGGDD